LSSSSPFLFPSLSSLVNVTLPPFPVFNFWEPLHYLSRGTGFQTWELSPQYAIRSWAYVATFLPAAEIVPYLMNLGKVHFFALSPSCSLLHLAKLTRLLFFIPHSDKLSSAFESPRPSSAPSSKLVSIEPSWSTSTIASVDTSSLECSSRLECGTLRLVSQLLPTQLVCFSFSEILSRLSFQPSSLPRLPCTPPSSPTPSTSNPPPLTDLDQLDESTSLPSSSPSEPSSLGPSPSFSPSPSSSRSSSSEERTF